MKLLWDSSSMTVYLGVVQDDGARHDYEWEAGRTLARDMLAFLRDKLALHGASFDDITGIGVMRGPGSFTGLRIGMTVLNTIASTNHVPIVGELGDGWRDTCLERLARGDDDKVVMPEYGGEAHITQPRK